MQYVDNELVARDSRGRRIIGPRFSPLSEIKTKLYSGLAIAIVTTLEVESNLIFGLT